MLRSFQIKPEKSGYTLVLLVGKFAVNSITGTEERALNEIGTLWLEDGISDQFTVPDKPE